MLTGLPSGGWPRRRGGRFSWLPVCSPFTPTALHLAPLHLVLLPCSSSLVPHRLPSPLPESVSTFRFPAPSPPPTALNLGSCRGFLANPCPFPCSTPSRAPSPSSPGSLICLPLFSLPDSWPRSPRLSFSPLDVPPPPCQASPHPYPDYRRNSKHPYLWRPIHPHSAHSHRLWAVASSQPLASLPIFPLWDSSLWVILTPPSPWPHPLLDSLP